jgi:hypothetical protein
MHWGQRGPVEIDTFSSLRYSPATRGTLFAEFAMRTLQVLTVVGLLVVGRAFATQFPVTKESGNWMILVQSYSGKGSAELAEELTASLRKDYHVNAFTFDRSEEERLKERERIAAIRKKREEDAKTQGLPKDTKWEPIRTYKIEDSYAVLIGGWADMESARKALDEIRKLKPPAERLMHQGIVVPQAEKGADRQGYYGGLNPFKTAFVVHNPLLPAPVDPEKGKLEHLKEYNANESLSLLKCRKPYTLMVKTYQGAVKLEAPGVTQSSFVDKLFSTKPGQLLHAETNQAHELAIALRQLKDPSGQPLIDRGTEIYVLHTEYNSIICIGGYDRPDDPALKTYQRKLAGLQLPPAGELSKQPLPMPVPKP